MKQPKIGDKIEEKHGWNSKCPYCESKLYEGNPKYWGDVVHCGGCTKPYMVLLPHQSVEDNVNSPSHYQGNGIEVIEVIDAFDLDYPLGNAIKYILRAEKKGRKIEDLKKAIWYINYEIENK